jgi:hypothetical protein
MINDFTTSKALLDKLKAFTDIKGLRLAVQSFKFEPIATETYLQETFLANDTDPLGINQRSTDEQRPIYQIDIYTQKYNGKFQGLTLANELKAQFIRASFIVNTAAQKVMVSNVNSSIGPSNNTHDRTIVSVNLVVLAANT